jgi:DNA polymerase-1
MSLLGKSKLAEKLASGIDPHTELACMILGISYEEGCKRKVLGAGDPEFHFARQAAKAANFGFPGGLGPKSFVEYARANYGVKLGDTYGEAFDKAKQIRFFWRQANPECWAYFELINQLTGGHKGQIEHLFSGRLRGDCFFTEAANSLFQGLGSDAAKAALYAVTRACRLGTYDLQGCHPAVFVHDEIIAIAPEERCHEAAHALSKLMVTAGSVFLPDVGCKTELFASRRWSKKAKELYDSNGRLIPWDG